ncbi:MAG: BolA family protein [Polyangia bacterium]
MSDHPTNFVGDPNVAIKSSIEAAIPGAKCDSSGGGGHFNIAVVSAAFEGKKLLEKQRMVLSAIAHLMKGDAAPVHAVDSLVTNTK